MNPVKSLWNGACERLAPQLWWWALANAVANILIVVTGAAVRLTGSGLGCPTWPTCTEDSLVTHPSMGIHGAIEFGNRMLTFVLAVIAIGCFMAALGTKDRRSVLLSFLIGLYIPAQAVIGGITVLTDLNPWVVGFHFMSSMVIIFVCVVLLDHLRSPSRPAATGGRRTLALALFWWGWVVLYLGVVVTGAGPHAGDEESLRNGLDTQVVSLVHGGSVAVLLVLTVALLVAARRAGDRWLSAVATGVLLLELAQGVVGWTQYFTDLPVLLVAVHMLLASLLAAGFARVFLAVRAHTDTTGDRGRLLTRVMGPSTPS